MYYQISISIFISYTHVKSSKYGQSCHFLNVNHEWFVGQSRNQLIIEWKRGFRLMTSNHNFCIFILKCSNGLKHVFTQLYCKHLSRILLLFYLVCIFFVKYHCFNLQRINLILARDRSENIEIFFLNFIFYVISEWGLI